MFSRAAKSIVKTLGSCRFHTTEQNLKTSKILMMTKKTHSTEINRPNTTVNEITKIDDSNIPNFVKDQGDNETKLVEALYRLPIGEQASISSSQMMSKKKPVSVADNEHYVHPDNAVLEVTDLSNMKIWQRNDVLSNISKWLHALVYIIQEHSNYEVFQTNMSKKERCSITREMTMKDLSGIIIHVVHGKNQGSSSLLNNHQESQTATTGSMKKFENSGIFRNLERHHREKINKLNNSIMLLYNKSIHGLHEIYSNDRRFSDNNNNASSLQKSLLATETIFQIAETARDSSSDHNSKNKLQVIVRKRDSETITNDALNAVQGENWIQRKSSKIKFILPRLHAKIRSYSTITWNSYCLGNIFSVNETISILDALSGEIILCSLKDNSGFNIQSKISEYCEMRKRSRDKGKLKKEDLCKKRENSCKMMEKKYGKEKKMCREKEFNCSDRRRQICTEQKKKSRSERGSDRASCKKKDDEIRKDESCKDDNARRTRKDVCKSHRSIDKEQISCKQSERKSDYERCKQSREDDYERLSSCRRHEERDSVKQIKSQSKCEEKKKVNVCDTEKVKEESKKSDCPEIKQMKPCEKKKCPTVTRAPDCVKNDGEKK